MRCFGLYFTIKNKLGPLFWAIVAGTGVAFGWLAHFSPFTDQTPRYICNAYDTPAVGWLALAWLVAQGNDIAPIPGTKRVVRVEENTAADRIELSAKQIERLNNLTPAAGERHDEGNMAVIDR